MRLMFLSAALCFLIPLAATGQVDTGLVDTITADTVRPPRPVTNLQAADKDNDHGHTLLLTWGLSPDDGAGENTLFRYEVFRWMPFYLDTVRILRDSLNAIIGYRAELELYLPRAERRLRLHKAGQGGESFPDSVPFYEDTIAAGKRWQSVYENLIQELRDKRDRAVDGIPQAHLSYPEEGDWRRVGIAFAGQTSYEDSGVKEKESKDYLADHTDYYYRVHSVAEDTTVFSISEVAGPVQSSGQLFNGGRTPVLVAVLTFGFLTVFFVFWAKKGKELYVRPLAGIEAVDDAIGRATEMGRPILYVMGLGTADVIATIASFTILGRVSRRVAEYQTKLIVPCYDPIVMSVAQETVKAGYSDAGRPDEYEEDCVYFVTQSQFAYVAAVNGTMLRELPATNIYIGKFYAESLILAETGALAGSIQIAGTDEVAQLPFFIVACDYTLIGEEMYAASAYLGREPILLGSLKAQDYAKALVIIFGIAGVVAASVQWAWFVNLFKVVD